MSNVQKPITILMDEFKEKFIDLLNNSQLPAWVLLYLIDPFVKQLQQFDEASRAQDKETYEQSLTGQAETPADEEGGNS